MDPGRSALAISWPGPSNGVGSLAHLLLHCLPRGKEAARGLAVELTLSSMADSVDSAWSFLYPSSEAIPVQGFCNGLWNGEEQEAGAHQLQAASPSRRRRASLSRLLGLMQA